MTTRRRAPRAPARDGSERPPEGEPPVVLYRTADDATRVALLRSDDQVWATQAQMAELFQTTVANIGSDSARRSESIHVPGFGRREISEGRNAIVTTGNASPTPSAKNTVKASSGVRLSV